MKPVRRVFRLSRLIVHVANGMLLTGVMAGVMRLDAAHPTYRKVKRWWLGRIVHIIGGRVQVHGEPAATSTLLVSNHVSWLDIPLLGGHAPVYFLSKSEVRHWPVIGWLADKSGTLFIERGGRDAAREAAETICRKLGEAGNVLVFPEGTTTDGVNLRTFHARLFAAAVEADAQVQPVAIRYADPQGQPHALVPYIDDQSLMDNLWAILAEPVIAIDIHFLPPMHSRERSRKELAQYSETQVRSALFGEADA